MTVDLRVEHLTEALAAANARAAELRRLLDRERTLVRILADDQPDGEELHAAEQALMAAWPSLAADRVYVEQLAQVAVDAAWAVNHTRRTARRDVAGELAAVMAIVRAANVFRAAWDDVTADSSLAACHALNAAVDGYRQPGRARGLPGWERQLQEADASSTQDSRVREGGRQGDQRG